MRMLRTTLAGVLTALFVVPITLLSGAAPALADTSQFKGVNWARLGDNFDTGPLVPQGLNLTDDYKTVQAKSDAMLTAFASLGANTVRLPLNPASVGTAWWDSYTAAIDTATAKGFKVVLSYWEEGARGGKIADLTTWNRMWDTVVAKYLPNARVYFDPMNEPHGYSGTEWTDLATRWIGDRPSVPKNRIIVSGIGFDWDIQTLCHDSRFDGTYLAYHHYSWDPDVQNLTTYDAWVADFKARMGNCASRTILEEFGATMDSGLDYNDRTSTDREVLYLRAYTDTARALNMGAIYWAGIGGRYLADDGVGGYETLNVQR
ncbi:MAG TPA: cellulase family glycosylhydrolase, partial [Amycolatopsis sp.]|nr:cellulase family glycosylhydrolase [Amycolatopsis sp.]